MIRMTDLNLYNKRVLIRSDLNVPIRKGKIISDIRIRYSLPTIEIALQQGAIIILASHLGRPVEGEYKDEFSLKPIVEYLKDKITIPVRLCKNYLNGIDNNKKELIVLENVRFNKGEKSNSEYLSKKYAELCDIFVMDAFGISHRIEASTCGVNRFVPVSCAGPLLIKELEILKKITSNPDRPMVSIVGGSKVSTKLDVLNTLSNISDQLIIGGGIANTFIAAQGNNIGKSLYEKELIPQAKLLMNNSNIFVPKDVLVSTEISENSKPFLRKINDIKDNEQIVDLGISSIEEITNILKKSKTVIWNGPVGMFEFNNFCNGTRIIANTIVSKKLFSIVGGGDTLAAIDLFNNIDNISYISTGGGAFLKFICGENMPAISILEEKAI